MRQPDIDPNMDRKSMYKISYEDDSFFKNIPYETSFAKCKNTLW
jgi:hypothetical protein